MIQPLLQQVATLNPELAQIINQNPEALYELLAGMPAAEGEDDDFGGGQVMQVQLTEEEAQAVQRVSYPLP